MHIVRNFTLFFCCALSCICAEVKPGDPIPKRAESDAERLIKLLDANPDDKRPDAVHKWVVSLGNDQARIEKCLLGFYMNGVHEREWRIANEKIRENFIKASADLSEAKKRIAELEASKK